MKHKGFVLMETIVVISVLSVVLVMLYGSYSNILTIVQNRSLYDNTEYIYKTALVRDLLESKISKNSYESQPYYVYCSNLSLSGETKCTDISTDKIGDKLTFLGVEAVYITMWNVNDINKLDLLIFEATTQNYIKQLDPPTLNEDASRIIVMYKQENNDTSKPIYEYATLRFGSRG